MRTLLRMLPAGAYGPSAWAFRVYLGQRPVGVVYQEGPLCWRLRLKRPVRCPGQLREWRDPRCFVNREAAADAAADFYAELWAAERAAEARRISVTEADGTHMFGVG